MEFCVFTKIYDRSGEFVASELNGPFETLVDARATMQRLIDETTLPGKNVSDDRWEFHREGPDGTTMLHIAMDCGEIVTAIVMDDGSCYFPPFDGDK